MKIDINTIHCPVCNNIIAAVNDNIDHYYCDICEVIWEIMAHEVDVGAKIDIE